MPPVDWQAVIDGYESGSIRGYVPSVDADRQFSRFLNETGRFESAALATRAFHLDGIGEGKLSLPFMAAILNYPGCLPGGAQGRGSCVAWSTRNAALVSYCASIIYGSNDQREALPVVSPRAVDSGVAATEGIYWFRRHGGDGWQCSAAAEVAVSECGLLLRQNYPELGFDLTTYSASTEGKWGRIPPPPEVREVCKQHVCSNATVVGNWEQARDMLAAGYAISTCGGEAFVRKRDAYGVCERSMGSWAHAMALIAADDRQEVREKYGGPLVLVQNSWGNYLTGPDVIVGTGYRIPVGSFWARWRDVERRYMVALGPSAGWPAVKMPDWGIRKIV